jgi:hypothetical protein
MEWFLIGLMVGLVFGIGIGVYASDDDCDDYGERYL